MAEEHSNRLVWAAIILGGILLLPVFAIIAGFNVVPALAIAAMGKSVWIPVAAVLVIAIVVAALRARRGTPTP